MLYVFNIRGITPRRYFFGVSACLGILFALLTEPEQSHSYINHLVMWQLQTLLPVSILVYIHVFLHKNSWFDRLNAWLKLFLSGVIGALIFVPLAAGIDVVWGNNQTPLSMLELFSLIGEEASGAVPPIVLSWTVINAPWVLLASQANCANELVTKPKQVANTDNEKKHSDATGSNQEYATGETKRANFMQLLPANMYGTLYYLKAELHYLEVVTAKGKALILYNLRDAISELPDKQGIQTHRSYWVNKQAVKSLASEGRQGKVILLDERRIPISRNRMKAVHQFLDE